MPDKRYIKIVAILSCLLFVLVGCDYMPQSKGRPIQHTQQETLEFIVANSDLIAIVDLSGGTDKPRPSFLNTPKKVNATIVSIIKGNEIREKIEIESTPKHLKPGAIMSTVVLRNGRYLVFLAKEGSTYQPTTGFSLLDIYGNKVHPVWKESGNPNEMTSGNDLAEIITEITNEIKNPKMLTRRST